MNPSPYMIYLQARGSILVASSPEILCHVSEDRVVTNRCAESVAYRAASVDLHAVGYDRRNFQYMLWHSPASQLPESDTFF